MIVKRICYKKNENGFSLAETLMAVLILLLVASVIVAGIPAAASAYKNAVDGANARALLSTTVEALRSELSTAWGVKVGTDEIYYYSSRTGAKTRLYNEAGTIKVQDYITFDNNTISQIDQADPEKQPVAPRELISDVTRKKTKDSTDKFNLAFTISPPGEDGSTDVVSFTSVTVNDGTKDIASLNPLAIRLIDSEFRIPELP